MSISPSKTRSLCTESEYNLVKWSSPRNVKTLTPAKLKEKLGRARKLRDKFRDLAAKQRGEQRGKREPSGTRAAQGNERTVLKAELFAQTLERFEQALKKAEQAEAKPANTMKKKSSKSASSKSNTASPAKADNAKSPSSGRAKSAQSSKKSTAAKKSAGSAAEKGSSSKPAAVPGAKISLAGPSLGRGAFGGAPSLGSASSNSLTDLFAASKSAQQSRETRRRDKSQNTKGDREQSRFAATSRDKIQGHVSAQTRRHQAKRDSSG